MSCYGLCLRVGDLPSSHLGEPLAVPFTAFDVEVGGDHCPYLQGELVDVVVQQRDSYFTWVLVLRLEDKHLLAPSVTRLGEPLL